MGWMQPASPRRAGAGFALSALRRRRWRCGGDRAPRADDKFPTREVRLIVPWNAGGSNDIAARVLAPILAENGMRIIVTMCPAAPAPSAWGASPMRSPDGYTLGMGTSSTLSMIAQNKTQLRNDQFASIAASPPIR